MSRTTDWILSMEAEYFDKCDNAIKESESYGEFIHAMNPHRGLVAWINDEDLNEDLHELWNEFWSSK